MSGKFYLRLVIIVCALSPIRVSAAEIGSEKPQEGLLVLANGSVIAGQVLLEGDYYELNLDKGKLQIRVAQVDFFCQTMAEAHSRRHARQIGNSPTADAHLEMAQWCLQHELFEFAVGEWAAARDLDPQHRLLAVVERRIVQAKEMAKRTAARSVSEMPKNPLVEQPPITSVAAEQESPGFGEIPLWARTEFIKRIQPMMVHSCATAGCHLPHSSQEMRIDRTALDGIGNPDLIHRNLLAVIAEVDLGEPDASRLLTLGATAHGKLGEEQSRSLTPHQLEIVRAWVTQLALGETPSPDADKTPRVAQIVVGMSSSAQQTVVREENGSTEKADPFDPTTFNRAAENNGPAPPDDETTDQPKLEMTSQPGQE